MRFPQHQELNPNFRTEIESSFNRQGLMRTFQARLSRIEPGEVHIEMPFSEALTQQDGYAHAGSITTILDNACGYAALSLAPAGHKVLTVEFKVNFLAPARAQRFQARAKVLRRGRTFTIVEAHAFAADRGDDEILAVMIATVFLLGDK